MQVRLLAVTCLLLDDHVCVAGCLQVRNRSGGPGGAAQVDSPSGDENFEALTKYGIDLTANAAHLDPVIGRCVAGYNWLCCKNCSACGGDAMYVPLPCLCGISVISSKRDDSNDFV